MYFRLIHGLPDTGLILVLAYPLHKYEALFFNADIFNRNNRPQCLRSGQHIQINRREHAYFGNHGIVNRSYLNDLTHPALSQHIVSNRLNRKTIHAFWSADQGAILMTLRIAATDFRIIFIYGDHRIVVHIEYHPVNAFRSQIVKGFHKDFDPLSINDHTVVIVRLDDSGRRWSVFFDSQS